MAWKYFYSSVRGTSHKANDTPKQDACEVCVCNIKSTEYLIAAIADGAGSAKYSDVSSKYACKLFIREATKWLHSNEIACIDSETVCSWIMMFQKVLHRTVKLYKLTSVRDFATTLLFCILSDKGNVFCQIGDGAISIGNSESLECVFWSDKGEFINTTYFATEQNFEKNLMFKFSAENIEKVAMHTDGIELISLDFANKKPHLPFFKPLFSALDDVKDSGYCKDLSKALGQFLDSEKVNKRTDDDKTLLLIEKLNSEV